MQIYLKLIYQDNYPANPKGANLEEPIYLEPIVSAIRSVDLSKANLSFESIESQSIWSSMRPI